MTPAEKAVIEAARTMVPALDFGGAVGIDDACQAVYRAIKALDAERSATPAEKPVIWERVVSDDEIYSTATKKWYRVRETAARPEGKVRVWVEGVAKSFIVQARDEVLCRRSETGRAVDTWVQVLSSR